MMKRYFLLALMSLCIGFEAYGSPVDLKRAKEIASVYMQGGEGPRLVKRRSTIIDSDVYQPLYVFSRGEKKGFVIVSGDDALPEVLGVTDSGDYDDETVPPALQEMLDYYSNVVLMLRQDTLLSDSLAKARVARKASGNVDIEPLMTSHHHQGWPYNNLCPYITGTTNRAATGCVATAASQIIYYWRRDMNDRTKYSTPTYGYGDAPVTESIPSGTPLKWDLMKDSYSGSESEEYTNAVATLVACVGSSAWLTYGSSTSGQISNCCNVFSGQFSLNGGTTVWKDSYSQSSWEKMIISDLELGRPILYSGVHPSNGGHAVVIDGYKQSSNTFHFNFGWGSGNGYDGYYTVDDATGMNGFYESQGMVYQIYPKQANVDAQLTYVPNQFVSRVDNSIYARVTNNGTLPQSGYYMYCLSSGIPSSSSTAHGVDTETIVNPGETEYFEFHFSPSGTSTYTVYLCDAQRNILDKVVGVTTIPSAADLTCNSITVDHGGDYTTVVDVDGVTHKVYSVYNTKKANVTVNFTNGQEGTFCTPTVKSILYKYNSETGEFEQSTTKTKKNVDFEVGQSADMVFDFSGLTDGQIYKFELAGTASTNKSYDIQYATTDTEVCFQLKGADMAIEVDESGLEAKVTGTYNASVFSALTSDSVVCRYDMTEVKGVQAPMNAANSNALIYVTAEQGVNGRNIVADGVCESLELTPGYNFVPKEDFLAQSAVYHAAQAVGKFSTAVLPFDAEVPVGMFARKVNMIKASYLQEVDSCNLNMYAGTPYIIITGQPVDITAKNVTVSINKQTLGTDTLKATWVNMVGTESCYMIDNEDTQYFSEANGQTIPALTGYLDYTRKVRATSYPYNIKDKKAKQLAEEIVSALNVLDEYSNYTTDSDKEKLLDVIREASDTLRTQPITSAQTSQIQALETAVAQYISNASLKASNGLEDKTSYVLNPSFELGSLKNWTVSGTAAVKNITLAANYLSGADGTYAATLNEGASVSQQLTVPNGVYTIVAAVGADYGNHIQLFANENTLEVEATDFGPLYLSDATLENVTVTDHVLNIGAATVDGWAKVDNFRLYLVALDESETSVLDVSIGLKKSVLAGTYDLSGRRVNGSAKHGMYIVDGKKVLR